MKTLLLLLLLSVPVCGADWYVSPSGSPSGSGSLAAPWDLRTALNHPPSVQPGDTVWVRGGRYIGNYTSQLIGTAASPIVFRAYPGERPVLDGHYFTFLVQNITDTERDLTVSQTSNMAAGQTIKIYNEEMQVSAVLSATQVRVNRHWGGTAATPHTVGTPIYFPFNAVLQIYGAHTWYWGLEIMDSDPDRVAPTSDGVRFSQARGPGLNVFGPYVRLINCVVHDCGDGIGGWQQAIDLQVYGCILFNNGVSGSGSDFRGHGSGFYFQGVNDHKRFDECVTLNNFASGGKAYGVTGAARGFSFVGHIAFNNGSPYQAGGIYRRLDNLFVGSEQQVCDDITVDASHLYQPPQSYAGGNLFGYHPTIQNGFLSFTNTYVIGDQQPLNTRNWTSVTFTGNTVLSRHSDYLAQNEFLTWAQFIGSVPQYNWNNNTYYDQTRLFSGVRYPFRSGNGGTAMNWQTWRNTTGFDLNSSYTGSMPTGTQVLVRPNAHETGRGNIVVYNWGGLASVAVDLSSLGYQPGDRYEIHDTQDFLGSPVAAGIYGACPVVLPLNLTKVTQPIGSPTVVAHTPTEFNAFVVRRQ